MDLGWYTCAYIHFSTIPLVGRPLSPSGGIRNGMRQSGGIRNGMRQSGGIRNGMRQSGGVRGVRASLYTCVRVKKNLGCAFGLSPGRLSLLGGSRHNC